MKRFGLAAVGGASRGLLAHVPNLGRRLGSVGSTSFRLAARIANGLKAGTAVKQLSELDGYQLILACAPGGTAGRLMRVLEAEGPDWHGKTLLLFDSNTYACDVAQFRARGAAVGSLNSIEDYPGRYVIEGDGAALREARGFVRDLGGKALELDSERVHLYDGARTLAGSLFTPLVETCTECIRQAGLKGPAAATLAEALFQKSLRAYMRSGRKSWAGPVAHGDRKAVQREVGALRKVKPLMAGYFQTAADFAFELYQTFPELTRYGQMR